MKMFTGVNWIIDYTVSEPKSSANLSSTRLCNMFDEIYTRQKTSYINSRVLHYLNSFLHSCRGQHPKKKLLHWSLRVVEAALRVSFSNYFSKAFKKTKKVLYEIMPINPSSCKMFYMFCTCISRSCQKHGSWKYTLVSIKQLGIFKC